MRKCQWIVILVLIGCAVSFTSCQRIQKVLQPGMPDPEPIETKMVEPPVVEPPVVETADGAVNVLIVYGVRKQNFHLREMPNLTGRRNAGESGNRHL